jgi:O-antigen/teichoic acid export membrane protein
VEDSVAIAYFPAAVAVHTKAETEREQRFYMSALKLVVVAMAFLMVVCAGYAGPILSAWVGPDIAGRSAAIFTILAIGYGLSALIGIPAQASDATGHQRWTAAFAIVSAILQLTLALILVPRYGPIGAAIAVLVNTVTQGTVFVLLVQHRFLRISLLTVLRGAVLRPALAALGVLVLVLLTRGNAHSPAAVLALLVAATILYGALTLALRVWTAEEIGVARQLLRAVWSRRPAVVRGTSTKA